MNPDQRYLTVDIERRGYGRRYTWLPVDQLSHSNFLIDCTGGYIKPEMIDIRRDDTVRWREGERLIEAYVTEVVREDRTLHVRMDGTHPLPPEAFYP
jgi:hypothetical protein